LKNTLEARKATLFNKMVCLTSKDFVLKIESPFLRLHCDQILKPKSWDRVVSAPLKTVFFAILKLKLYKSEIGVVKNIL